MPSFGNMFASLTLESASFMSGLDAARKSLGTTEKTFKQIGSNLQKAGAVMTVGITAPFIAYARSAMEGALAQRQAMAQVTASLDSMGPVAQRTAQQLSAAADAFEARSLVDADVILKDVTANLLTYGRVTGATFDRAQQAILDLSQKTGKGLLEATTMVGKALNDPAKGLAALTKVGIQFTDSQKAAVKAMLATGDIAGAQAIILGELEHQFKGSAEAAAKTDPYRQMQVAFDQVADVVGEIALDLLPPLTSAIKSIADVFLQLSPRMQQIAVGGVAISAALGPVLGLLGTMINVGAPVLSALSAVAAGGLAAGTGGAAAATGLAAAGTAAAPLAGVLLPVAAAVAAIYLAWQNWDKIAPILSGVANQAKTQTATIDGYLKTLNDSVADFDRQMGIPSKDEFFASVGRNIQSTWTQVNQYDLARWARGVDAEIARSFKSAVASAERLYAGIKTWIVDKLSGVFTWVSDKAREVGDAFFQLYDRVVGHSYVPDMVDGIATQMARLDAVMVKPTKAAVQTAAAAFKAMADEVRPLLDEIFPEARAMRDLEDKLAVIERARKAGSAGGGVDAATADEAHRRLIRGDNGPGPAVDPAEAGDLVEANVAIEELMKTLPDLSKTVGQTTGKVMESFSAMAQDVIGAVGSIVDRLRSKDWLGALQGVLDVVMKLGEAGVFGSKMQATIGSNAGGPMSLAGARANGGSVLANRNYLVGERGPEILRMGGRGGSIVPNDQIGGPMTINVAVEEGALFRPVVRSEAGQVSYQVVGGNNRNQALRQRQALA